jgi:acid stress-induced BolA-like protein IbaG/YrbA
MASGRAIRHCAADSRANAASLTFRCFEVSMSSHPTEYQGSIIDALREAIERDIPGAQVEVTGGGGHFSIEVVSQAFAGKSMLASQRLVYGAIAHLMSGDMAPVHAIDSLITRVPAA